ncbi:hypothetical protein RHMOL_Rhmol13G0273100 [Rhododendron molle]|uniref:Uncharacterized protein n=1 Tax=Rhododendron molle TaxID=49168 RepID=A0ACC0LCC9_RHOML|nr:hypothetical protein RHMOL_Rhmol13G0273100 [Rhododendron molle]
MGLHPVLWCVPSCVLRSPLPDLPPLPDRPKFEASHHTTDRLTGPSSAPLH